MSLDLQKFEKTAEHTGAAIASGLKALASFVQALAPVAEVVGEATGQPEVVAGAKIAETASTAFSAAEAAKAGGK